MEMMMVIMLKGLAPDPKKKAITLVTLVAFKKVLWDFVRKSV